MSEPYIPSASDATIAYFGRSAAGYLRLHCVVCCDNHPLTDAHRVYGDCYVSTGDVSRVDESEPCDICGVTMLTLSESCQREHDEQQARFARQPVLALVEYGIPAAVRCRVY